MAILPTKLALGTVMPQGSRPIAVADTTAIGRGVAQLGQGLQEAGADFDYMAKKQAAEDLQKQTFDGAASVQQFQNQQEDLARKAQQNMPLGGAGAADAFRAQYQKASAGLLATLPAPLQARFKPHIIDLEGNLTGRMQQAAVGEQQRYASVQENDRINANIVLASNDPTNIGLQNKLIAQDIERIKLNPNLTAPQKQEAIAALPKAYATGLQGAVNGSREAVNGMVIPLPSSVATGAPAKGLISNNPGNLKYFPGSEQKYPGVIGPSAQVDQGTPQVQFASGEAGMQAAGQLALQKFDSGLNTVNKIVTDHNQGWTPDNTSAAEAIAKRMGVDVNAPLNLRNKGQLQFFLKALVQQEQSNEQAARYPDQLYAKGAELALAGGKPNLQAGPGYAGNGTTPIEHPAPGPGGPRANFANVQNMGDPRQPGWEQANLTTIQAGNGQTWQVNKKAAAAFQGFLQDLEAEGYTPKSSGGYNYRTIRGSGKLSQHAFGTAIDIGAEANPMGGTTSDLPANVGEIAAKHGLVWGGNWTNRKDPMHFEWAGDGSGGGSAVPDNYATARTAWERRLPGLTAEEYNHLASSTVSAASAFAVQDRANAAAADQQRKSLVDQYQYGARNGQVGDADIEQGWQTGTFKTYEEYASVRAARDKYLEDRDKGAGAVDQIFGDNSTTQFNPFDTESKKIATNAYNEITRGAPDKAIEAVDAIQKRTGIVPQPAANGLRAAIYGADLATGGQAMQIASNLMARNPNAFAGVDGGDQIAKSAVAYQHFIEQGATTEDATRRVMQMNDPAYRSKVTVKDDDLKKFNDGITAASVGKIFDTSILPFNDPRVGVSPEQQNAIVQDFREVAEQFYKESGDANLAMAQAKSQLSRVYGVSAPFGQQTVTKFPPERSYPPVPEVSGDDGHAYIYRQASEAVKQAIGKDIPAADIALLPLPTATAQAFDAGKPAPYRLAYVDRSSGQPVLQYIYGPSGKAAFVADPVEAQAAVESGRAAAFRALQETSPPKGTPMATKDQGRYTPDMAPKETSDGQGAMLPTSEADRKQWADEQNARLDMKKRSVPNIPPVSADTRAYSIGAGPDYADTPAPPAAAAPAPTIPAAPAGPAPSLPPPTQDEAAATVQRRRQIQVDERRKKAGLAPYYKSDIPE